MQDSSDEAQRHARLLAEKKKADEIQSFADRKDMKKFFDALKTVYGPQSSGTTPLLSADGTSLLTDKEAILKRWAEHFDGVLNRPSSIDDEAINRLPQVECNPLLDELPTVSETVKAIKLLSSDKAPGSDAIPAEIYKAGGPPVAEKLTIISHYVEKRSHPSRIQGCKNYPPIQKERESSSLWHSSRYLFIVNCREDSCEGYTEPIEWTPGTVRASTRKPVWIQEKQRNNRHYLHGTTASRKMPGTECGPLHDLCRPYQSIWHSQSWGTLENYGKVWFSCQIHSNGAAIPWWYACKGPKRWRVFWSISCDKWS